MLSAEVNAVPARAGSGRRLSRSALRNVGYPDATGADATTLEDVVLGYLAAGRGTGLQLN